MTNTVKMTVAEADSELRKALSKAPSLPITHPLGLRLARRLIRLFLRTSKNALKDVAVSKKWWITGIATLRTRQNAFRRRAVVDSWRWLDSGAP